MAEIRQYKCDVCGALKGDTNHWWRVEISLVDTECVFTLQPFGDGCLRPGHFGSHLCGERCVIVKVSEFMGAK